MSCQREQMRSPARAVQLAAFAGAAVVVVCVSPHAWVQTPQTKASGAGAPPAASMDRASRLRGGATLPREPGAGTSGAFHALAAGALLAAASGLHRAAIRRSDTGAMRAKTIAVAAVGEARAEVEEEEEEEEEYVTEATGEVIEAAITRRNVTAAVAGVAAGAVASEEPAKAGLFGGQEEGDAAKQWIQYDLNSGETLYDIDFDLQDPQHGFIVGAHGLFYESKDGGKRWVSRSFQNLTKGADESQYRFQTVSVSGNEVWIIGKPPLLLHSKDSGKSWKKVPLSKKLPGEPKVIIALGTGEDGKGKAELATSSGAVYVTDNDGRNWTSQVRETVDATLNRVSSSGVSGASYFTGSVKSIKRDASGQYLAVAQRGNFYLTFTPGQPRWVPHNRVSARRIQAMGFKELASGDKSSGAWMSLNGGLLQNCSDNKFTDMGEESKDLFTEAKIKSGGIGIIDLAYRTDNEAWAVGGSGVIYSSRDGGQTWEFDKTGDELPCNLYNVKFFNQGKVGFMIGSNGILLRKEFQPEAVAAV